MIDRPGELQAPERRISNGLGESVHRFGAGLIGVLHRPHAQARGGARNTAVILFNAGLVHRAGPYRGYVRLARALAAAGFAVLRFDQAGRGDSPTASPSTGDRHQREAQAAMTLIGAETGAMRFVLGGICSGADDAFHIAVRDRRVAGAILLDGPGYRTRGFWIRHLLPRLFSPRRWLSLARRLRAEKTPGLLDYRDFPERADAARQLAGLVDRGVRLLCLYTSGSYYYFNHAGQFAAALGRAGRAPQVRVELWRDCEHTFYLRRERERLVARVTDWMLEEFPASSSERTANAGP
ncbi:serine aminopeptidase domain-containing protein [Marilutibacter alkalisoli]|nr:alpha/beta hydrolase [Lysobacter alkalisoli]